MASPGLAVTSPSLHVTHNSSLLRRSSVVTSRPRSPFLCQSRLPTDSSGGGGGGGDGGGRSRPLWVVVAEKLSGEAGKAGKAVQETLGPKQKGDWKDVTLMSFSFAVYVYISQKIVCAYCAWMSMTNH